MLKTFQPEIVIFIKMPSLGKKLGVFKKKKRVYHLPAFEDVG